MEASIKHEDYRTEGGRYHQIRGRGLSLNLLSRKFYKFFKVIL